MTILRRALRATVQAKPRLETLYGKERVVVSVVALVEGVIRASNASAPELVLAEEFGKVPEGWNGRPVMFDHPEINGGKVSANSPRVLERFRLGDVFNSKMNGKKLVMEAWLDEDAPAASDEKAAALVAAVKRGEMVEVSVGVFVTSEEKSGTHTDGKKYASIWRDIVPDHLALLPEGTIGACSIEMGCGTSRAAKRGENGVKLNEAQKKALARFIASQEMGTSDNELRRALDSALFATEPGYLGVLDVFQETSEVVYMVAPDGEPKSFKRGYTMAEDGEVKLGSEATQVEQVVKYENAAQQAAEAAKPSAACGCTPAAVVTTASTKETDMDKKARVLAVVTKLAAKHPQLYKLEDAAAFEALPDERIAALEAEADKKLEEKPASATTSAVVTPPAAPTTAAAAAPAAVATAAAESKKTQTEEEYLAGAPESIRTLVAEDKARKAARKTELVARLASSQKTYTEDELKALEIPALEKLDKALAEARPAKARDFSGNGPTREASKGDDDKVDPAPSMRERLVALSGGKK